MRASARGFSLVEILVVCSLLALVLTGVVSALTAAFRNSARYSARVEMQEQASLVLDMIRVDLERSASSAVTLLPQVLPNQPSGLAIQRLAGFTGQGTQEWEPQLLVYYWLPSSQRLKKESWQAGLPPALPVILLDTRPSRITQQDLFDIINDAGSERVLATGVQQFEVGLASPPAMQPLVIGLTLERQVPGRASPERFQLRRFITLRNSG